MKYLNLVLICLLLTTTANAAVFKFGGIKHDLQDVVTAAGTTTLVKTSKQVQRFTGVANQNVNLPDATTLLETGWWYVISNISTGVITIRDNGNNVLGTVPAAAGGISTSAVVYLTDVSTANGVWDVQKPVADLSSPVGVLPIANGGTNSSTALSNNRVMKSSGGAIVEAAAITANRALASDANGIPVHTAVTDTELGYVSGVTSAIQTQLNGMVKRDGSTALTANWNVGAFDITAQTFIGPLTGNASTASALAANPSDCAAGQYAIAIAANGNLTCAAIPFSDITGTASVAQTTVANQALAQCTTARTVNWATGNSFTLTLTDANNCAITFSNAVSGQTITIDLTQDTGGAGDATVSWATSTLWSGGTPPTITVGADATDSCTIKYNGTDYRGSCVQDFQ